MDNYLDNAPCFYFSCTDDGRLLDINETACTALGYTRQELQGSKVDTIFTMATRIFYQTHFFPLLKMQHHAEEIYISLQHKNKEEIPVLLNAKRMIVDDQAMLLHTCIMVQRRKKYEDELIAAKKSAETALRENTYLVQARQQLQESFEQLDLQMQMVNKQNAELKQFNHVVTHDLQEPLRKLSVFINLFLDDPGKKDPRYIAEKVMTAAQRIRAVLSGLQQYVWLIENPAAVQPVNLNQLLTKVKQDIAAKFPGVELLLQADELPAIPGDEEQLRVLLYHLFSNAVMYRKPGNIAHVHVSGSIVQRNKFKNITGKYDYTGFLNLQFKDDGTGFDPQYATQAFDLFRKLHTGSGLGIGLSLCKKIAEHHHGNIWLDTGKDKGTTVTILLPLGQ